MTSTQIPTSQKAWRIVARGPPSTALKLDKELPVPTKFREGEVLIKVQAAALNPVGYKLMKWLPNLAGGRPATAEYDFSGTVVKANGTKFSNGDQVFGWIPVDLNRKTRQGALSEYTVAPASYLALRPPNLTPIEASGICLTSMTAYQMLFQFAKLEEGQSLFVNGGSTAVGTYAIQFAKAIGVKVVASASERNREFVLGLGADEFIDYTKQDLATYLSQNPPTTKFNVFLEAVGLADDSLYVQSEKYLAPGGVFLTVGPQPAGWASVPKLLKLCIDLIRPTWLGGVNRKWMAPMVKQKEEDLEAIRKLIADGKVKPVVDSVYSFEDALKAYDRIGTTHCTGKVVVKVDPSLDQGIRDMAPIIDPEDDYLTIAAAEEQMALRAAQRKKELEAAHSNLKSLSRIFDSARASSTRSPSVPSAEKHAETLNELDAGGISLAKAINDAESALAQKQAELTRLKEEARALEESDPAAEHDLDGTALRLQIYKGLGFEPVLSKDGHLEKLLVESASGDIHVVRFDEGRSEYETADLLWKLAAS
ncbi:hypothetical protein EW146_g5661 [Bondarzewia mesenterica]|uniref:Enoyl reductase (ER) domain-containing protein n=1 Tax=Bondarzewia mesenterica TaxID=1095465 RepID=A0A4S4LQU7_9AGAM|nr:hypothetical protein EW146_g5661 [Bondarzewia mesenterica]